MQYSMLIRGVVRRPCAVVIRVFPPYKRIPAAVTRTLSAPLLFYRPTSPLSVGAVLKVVRVREPVGS